MWGPRQVFATTRSGRGCSNEGLCVNACKGDNAMSGAYGTSTGEGTRSGLHTTIPIAACHPCPLALQSCNAIRTLEPSAVAASHQLRFEDRSGVLLNVIELNDHSCSSSGPIPLSDDLENYLPCFDKYDTQLLCCNSHVPSLYIAYQT